MADNISDAKYGVIRKAVQFAALFGYRLEIEGRQENLIDNINDLREGVIFAGNHESVIDAFLMGLVVPSEMKEKRIFFLGKKSALWKNRFWGAMMDYFGVIPVKKRDNQEAIKRGIDILRHNQALGIFPEGHIRYSRKELEGKVGVARFAFETDSPVIPVGIIGTDGILPYGGNWPTPGKKVTLRVGNPIFLHYNYEQKDIFNPYALRAATDLIMHEIRILSQGYGIPPNEARTLRCMDGIQQVMTPPKWLLKKKKIVDEWNKRKKRKDVVDSFEDWLAGVPQAKSKIKRKKTREDVFSKKLEFSLTPTDEFLEWLDDQL
ncbi:MAG: 1-acyl-sn-glycerol-3-phosphate acyltransferase [Candidatus Heimdallarchaeota archaeon]|nr:MAG: 1-acyl-sn-glycerol-3-phosphate acyltransferase [Candidatus Heimdallarchaeota archaeon]